MTFNHIRVVLVATSHPGNIGSTARAMKTMGMSRLYLVKPKFFPDKCAYELAAGADDILNEAIVTQTLTEALHGCQLVLATSARVRDIALPMHTPASAATWIAKHPSSTEIAIVFGREHAGLTNDELLHCHCQLSIPSNPSYSSLNLAQAVQIIAYELRMKLAAEEYTCNDSNSALASVEMVEQFYAHLREILIRIDFLKRSNPKRLLQRLRRLFNRSQLEATEVNILRGILTHIEQALSKPHATHQPKEVGHAKETHLF